MSITIIKCFQIKRQQEPVEMLLKWLRNSIKTGLNKMNKHLKTKIKTTSSSNFIYHLTKFHHKLCGIENVKNQTLVFFLRMFFLDILSFYLFCCGILAPQTSKISAEKIIINIL